MSGAVTSFSCQTVVKACSSCRTEEERERERGRRRVGLGAEQRLKISVFLSPPSAPLNAGFVYVAPFCYSVFLPGDMSLSSIVVWGIVPLFLSFSPLCKSCCVFVVQILGLYSTLQQYSCVCVCVCVYCVCVCVCVYCVCVCTVCVCVCVFAVLMGMWCLLRWGSFVCLRGWVL